MTMPTATPERDARAVQLMFDRIASRYDLLNTLLSFGADARWRRLAAQAAELEPGGRALDVACGSGKLSHALRQRARGGCVVGLDFSAGMLAVASRTPGPHWVRADGLGLPFADGVFDAVTVAFGLRNFADPVVALGEMLRVLRPGGRAVVLEFVRPRPDLLGRAYRAYLRHLLPRIGGLISGDRAAYRYLSDSVDSYRTGPELVALAADAGWQRPQVRHLTLGTVALLIGRRPRGVSSDG
jgi:demethylmenaquinone methyltransferase/2-methoxy-6-polyprenyl-1,4-benzoquinol methylase